MNAKATPLDQLLYAWLAEPDDRKFDLAFRRYYESASPGLMRYLERRSSLADLDCEQIAVDALLKFFARAGRERRQAIADVSSAVPKVKPLNLGLFHVRQVGRWTGEIEAFKHLSITFKLTLEDRADRPWKAEIQAQAQSIPPLQRQGLHILGSIRAACASLIDGGAIPSEIAEDGGKAGEAPAEYELIRAFAALMCKDGDTQGVMNAESHHPGVTLCVDGAWTIVDVLPALRIPTNGYLFDIAQSLYLDECKARGRKKRGGEGMWAADHAANASTSLAPFDLDAERDSDEGPADAPGDFAPSTARVALATDPTAELVDEDFCRKFYRYLSKPLDDAQEAYRLASSGGKAEAARKRLDSISEKHARFMAVLAMRIEGHTQEAVAESLGLSRNQVKYINEQAQEAYQRFCDAELRSRRT